MKSFIKLVLVISLLCVPLLSKENVVSLDNQAYTETFKEPQEQNKEQHHKKIHTKNKLRMSGFSAQDAYEEIKKLEAQDKAKLDQLENNRLLLIETKTKLLSECETETTKTASLLSLIKKEESLIDYFTSTKNTLLTQKITCENQVIQYQKDYNIQDGLLKELQNQLVVKQTLQVKIKVDIENKKAEILRLQLLLEQSNKDKVTLEASLGLETSLATQIQSEIIKQQSKVTETTTCITKKNQEIDIIVKNITETTQEVANHTNIKTSIQNEQYQPQVIVENTCKNKQEDNRKTIETIQTTISEIKVRICAYFTKTTETTTKTTSEVVTPPSLGKTSANIEQPKTLQSKP